MALQIQRSDNVSVENPRLEQPIANAIASAAEIAGLLVEWGSPFRQGAGGLGFALQTSLIAVNALLAAASTKCTIGGAPADIDMVTNASGKLIYRCQHNPIFHEWDLSGNQTK